MSGRAISSALRIRKDPDEIELLRSAAAAVDRAVGRLQDHRFSGKTEFELSEEVAALAVEEGSDVATFRIVAAGPNSASPHHEPGDRVIQPGDAVVVDFGGKVGGYCSDTTRTVVMGQPDDPFRKVFTTVVEARDMAQMMIGEDRITPNSAAAAMKVQKSCSGEPESSDQGSVKPPL